MIRENKLVVVGLGLLALAFVAAAVRVFTREGLPLGAEKKIRLSFAHYLVYESNRVFFNAAIREYERLHPNVTIEQLDVPPPVWPTWRQTRFTGNTAPDIMQVGRGMRDDQFALYMRPLTEAVHQPNPYNRGTELEGVPWKDTFVDGLMAVGQESEGFRDQLMEYYGVATYLNIVRVYYNRDLYEKIVGHDRPPRSLQEFVALCEQTLVHGRERGIELSPVAGSIEYSRNLFDRVVAHQTQRLDASIDLQRDGVIRNMHREHAIAWLRGEWKLEEPPVRTGLELIRELARYYQPGFLNATRDEAGFLFKQGRTLMIVSGSWDANYFMVDTKFRVGAFDIPLPTRDDGVYGAAPRGRLVETGGGQDPQGGLGITRASKHPEVALDFLRFLTSRQMNQKFADECLRVPVIVGAKTPGVIDAFEPQADGYPAGFNLLHMQWASRATERFNQTLTTELVRPTGSVARYIERFRAGYAQQVRHDLDFETRERTRALMRSDALILALSRSDGPRTELDRQRLRRLEEFQTQQEAEIYQSRLVLRETAAR